MLIVWPLVVTPSHINILQPCAQPAPLTACIKAVQVVIFADDKTVSKGMVKYASLLPRESVIDVEGIVHVPPEPVQGCSQSEARDCSLPFAYL